jgi:hypothetical protein
MSGFIPTVSGERHQLEVQATDVAEEWAKEACLTVIIPVQNSYMINIKHVRQYHHGDHTIYLSENLTATLFDSFRENFMTHFR